MGAREVRKRLAQYYVLDGLKDSIRIDLPLGSYAPQFHYHAVTPAMQGIEQEAEQPVAEKQYVGFGDLVACSKLTQMFGQREKDTRLRMASMEITQKFRYRFRLARKQAVFG